MAMSLKSPFGQQSDTTPVPTKRKTRLKKTDDIVLPFDLEDISGQPRIRSINHIMTHDPFVENLSRPDGCKSDKVTVPEYMSAFITNKDLPEYWFPWGKRDIVIGRSFWLRLSCLNIGKSGWLTDQHLDLWIDLMWSLRPPEADWAIVSPHFSACILNRMMSDYFLNGHMYPLPWIAVEKVYFLVNEPKEHWCLAELEIRIGVVTFYDSLAKGIISCDYKSTTLMLCSISRIDIWRTVGYGIDWKKLDNDCLPRESIRFKCSSQVVVGRLIFWAGHERFVSDDGQVVFKKHLLVSFDLIGHSFQVHDIDAVFRDGLTVPMCLSSLRNSLILFGSMDETDFYLFCGWSVLVDVTSVTSFTLLFAIPTPNYVKLLGVTMDEISLLIVEVPGPHQLAKFVYKFSIYNYTNPLQNLGIQGGCEELFGPMTNPNVALISSPEEMSQAWFKASAEFIKGLDDQGGTFFQDDQVREKCMEQHNGMCGDTEDDDGDGVLDSQTKDVIEEVAMLPTMSSNSPQAGNAAVSEFFAEFDALKKEVLLKKRRKDDKFDELTKIFSKLETSEIFVKFKKLLINDLCTENKSSDCNQKKSDVGVSIEEKPNFSSHHNDSSNHIGGVSSEAKVLMAKIGLKCITEGYEYKVVRSCPERYAVECVHLDCYWYIFTRRIKKENGFRVTYINDNHTCPKTQFYPNHRNATAKMLCQLIIPKFRDVTRVYRPKDIINDLNIEFNIDVSYKRAWKGKQLALKSNQGDPISSFAQLPYYCYNLKLANENTVTHIDTDHEGRFKMLFIAFGAAVRI
ncbi:phospholipase-like protein [Tanacetum coccineum]